MLLSTEEARTAAVCFELSKLVYSRSSKQSPTGQPANGRCVTETWPQQLKLEVPATNGCNQKEALPARLLYASLGVVEYGIWNVENVGVVVAFRGTTGVYDVITDVDCFPHQTAHDGVRLHKGMYNGAQQEAEMIYSVCQPYIQKGSSLKLTGHSLGGGYAKCLLLCMLLGKWEHLHKVAVTTFGAPLVVADEGSHDMLVGLYKRATGASQLPIVNLVNDLDPVPRVLGPNLPWLLDTCRQLSVKPFSAAVTDILTQKLDEIRHYVPIGHYVLFIDGDVHSCGGHDRNSLHWMCAHYQQLLGRFLQLRAVRGFLRDHELGGYQEKLHAFISRRHHSTAQARSPSPLRPSCTKGPDRSSGEKQLEDDNCDPGWPRVGQMDGLGGSTADTDTVGSWALRAGAMGAAALAIGGVAWRLWGSVHPESGDDEDE